MTTQWFISKFDHIGYVSNIHATSIIYFNATESNNHRSSDNNNTRTCRYIESDNIHCPTSQQVQAIQAMVNSKKKKKFFFQIH